MTLKTSIGYFVQCDYPGCEYTTEDCNGEYSSWTDASYAVEEWTEGDAHIAVTVDGVEKHYCPGHVMWGGEDDDELVPVPEGIEGALVLMQKRLRERIAFKFRAAALHHEQRCRELGMPHRSWFTSGDLR
ncbi:MAG TPA: hypothetical protein VN133_13695 [Humibacter sp.]|nr:hypothetical protein [Humibacter sp.]